MIPRELIEGVQKMLSAGAPREVVREFLLERGWSEAEAKEVFASLEDEEKQKETPKEVVKKQVPPRTVTPPPEPRRENQGRRILREEKKGTELPVVKTASHPIERSPKKDLPLVVTQKEREVEKPVVHISKRQTEEKTKIPYTRVRGAEKEKVHRSETQQRSAVRPAKKEQRRFLTKEGEEEGEKAELFEMSRLSSPFTLLSAALSLVKHHFWNLFFLSFMVSVLYLVLYIVFSYILTGQNIENVWSALVERDASILMTTSVLVVVSMVVSFVCAGLLLWLPASYILSFSGRTSSFRDSFVRGFKAGFSFFVAIIFVLLFVLSGSVLLLVPGVLLGVWFIFAPIITVAERTSPFVALLVSRELVRNHFWDVVLREVFLLIPVLLASIVLLLVVTPLSLLDSLGLGVGLIVLIFVSFAAVLFFFAFMLFFFAYHVTLYREMRARAQSIKLSSRLARTLPFLLIIPLLLSLAVALYVSSLF